MLRRGVGGSPLDGVAHGRQRWYGVLRQLRHGTRSLQFNAKATRLAGVNDFEAAVAVEHVECLRPVLRLLLLHENTGWSLGEIIEPFTRDHNANDLFVGDYVNELYNL